MSDPDQASEQDELELEPETIADLELRDDDANEVRGGCYTTTVHCNVSGGGL
jgi:hypothetical protein